MYALEYFNSYVLLKKEDVNFKLASLNVRGIRSSTKRKALFTWLNERKYDIIFLQETYSTVDVEYIWKTQWKGKLYFSHGPNHSCGVMVLVRGDLSPSEDVLNSFLNSPKILKLSDNDIRICDGKLTVDECYKSLQLFESNKSTGNDGLTVEYYRAFWQVLGSVMVDSLN